MDVETGTDIPIRAGNSLVDFIQGQVEGLHLHRVDLDMDFLVEPTKGQYVGDALDLPQHA